MCKIYSDEMLDLAVVNLCSEIYPNIHTVVEIKPTEEKKKKSFFGKK